MDTGIKIGPAVLNAESFKALTGAVREVLNECYVTHCDQETTRRALDILAKCASLSNLNITGCSIGDVNE